MNDDLATIERAPSLLALIDRASTRLRNARNSAEVFEAKRIADLALHYAKLTNAANETRIDCLRIITLAETRLADEMDAAQARGEVASPGRPNSPNLGELNAIGIPTQRLAEWRQVRDAGQETVERVFAEALAERRTPTKGEILQAARAFRRERTFEKQIRRDQRERSEGVILATENAARRLHERTFGLIYSDPGWDHETWSEAGKVKAAANHYSTSSIDTIRALRPPAAANCVLAMWAAGPFVAQAYRLMDEWGYATDKAPIVWKKPNVAMGYWSRVDAEFLLLGTLGNPVAPAPGTRTRTIIEATADNDEPNRKPAIFAQLLERWFPNTPRLEMYARPPFRSGWTVWGNEVPGGMMEVP